MNHTYLFLVGKWNFLLIYREMTSTTIIGCSIPMDRLRLSILNSEFLKVMKELPVNIEID